VNRCTCCDRRSSTVRPVPGGARLCWPCLNARHEVPSLVRLDGLFGRARCPGWKFSPVASGARVAFLVFRPHPETGALQKLGLWPLPDDPGEDEVREACLAAVVEVDGESARERFAWLPPKGAS
jgi:hypothetical protein